MNLIGLGISIVLQVIGMVILLIPTWELPLSYREIVDAGAKYSIIEERKKIHRKLFNIGFSGTILIVLGLVFQIYFTCN
ncbi:MAG: hypothetical protein JSW06_01640 [Thermoplasmatales archaeon]|nr:MAG: hypothetical protein JSW06_01640 [Thermoplasmatales archaeon]